MPSFQALELKAIGKVKNRLDGLCLKLWRTGINDPMRISAILKVAEQTHCHINLFNVELSKNEITYIVLEGGKDDVTFNTWNII